MKTVLFTLVLKFDDDIPNKDKAIEQVAKNIGYSLVGEVNSGLGLAPDDTVTDEIIVAHSGLEMFRHNFK